MKTHTLAISKSWWILRTTGAFDTTAAPGSFLYKVDICSLYPACCRLIEYLTRMTNDLGEVEEEWQTPLAEWYTGFPDPTINFTTGEGGWLEGDFNGVEMTDKEYEELHVMHGLIRITFDQTDMTRRCPADPTKKGFPFSVYIWRVANTRL